MYLYNKFMSLIQLQLNSHVLKEREDLDDLYRLISIEVKGHDKEVLRSYMTFLTGACKELEIKVGDM